MNDRKNAPSTRSLKTIPTSSIIGPPRGVLQGPRGPGDFYHARVAPPSQLRNVVQHFWIVRWDLRGCPAQVAETLPHPNVHLTFEAQERRIYGIQCRRFTRVLEGHGVVVGVKFTAGGFRPFLQRSVSTLRNRSIGADAIFEDAASSVPVQALLSPDDALMIEAVTRFLLEHLPSNDPNVERVASIVSTIESDRTLVTVEQLLERWSMTKRTLQRLFNEYVGVGPKWVINRYRLHEAVERLHAGASVDWTRLALDLGYFDQSHFIRDFRLLVGRSPAQYARMVQQISRESLGKQLTVGS